MDLSHHHPLTCKSSKVVGMSTCHHACGMVAPSEVESIVPG